MRADHALSLLPLVVLGACATTGGEPGAGTGSGAAPAAEERPVVAPSQDPGTQEGGGLPISGQLSSRYRHRSRDGEQDDDLYMTLALDVGDPQRHAVTGHLMGRAALDFGERDPGDVFHDLDDTYDNDLTGRLYFAYADVHRVPHLERLRLGRQQLLDTPELVTFDGLLLKSEEVTDAGLSLGLYGGLPTHYYESSPSGDQVVGTWLQARPWKGGRARLDWMHLEDEARLGQFEDDLYGLSLWQVVSERLWLEGRYDRLEDDDRDVRLAATWYDPRTDLMLRASYFELLETQVALSNELDPFYNSLRELYPYSQTTLLASKGLGEHVDLQLGADLRRVDDAGDEGPFNRDFDRYFASASLLELLGQGLALHLSGDLWDSDDQDVESLGVELEKQLDARFSVGLGTYYSLYKVDLVLDQEREDVRTYFVRARWRKTAARQLDVAYELEDDETDEYHVIRVGATWRF